MLAGDHQRPSLLSRFSEFPRALGVELLDDTGTGASVAVSADQHENWTRRWRCQEVEGRRFDIDDCWCQQTICGS